MTMRVLVASDFEPGSHRAHAINVVKTAGGFRRLGCEVTVLCRAPAGAEDLGALVAGYHEPQLTWRTVPVDSRTGDVGPGRERVFAAAVAAQLEGIDLVYARHFRAGLAAANRGVPAAIETHAHVGDPNHALKAAIDATHGALACLVTISEVLAEHYAARGGDRSRIHVVPDGVDVELFQQPAREPSPPPFGRRFAAGHVVYAGHLYDYKGIPTVLAAAALLPAVGFELLGGAPDDIARTRLAAAAMPNVRVHGQVPHVEVPRWLWHADALLLPPSANHPSAAWTSPVKLGEYLASTRPIVAAAIPGLQAWVDESLVTWFRPDDGHDLVRAVRDALAESDEHRRQRVVRATARALAFDYRERAAKILQAVATALTSA